MNQRATAFEPKTSLTRPLRRANPTSNLISNTDTDVGTTLAFPAGTDRRPRSRRDDLTGSDKLAPITLVRSYVNRVLAALVLFVLSPLFLAIGLWIRRDSPGAILFRQPRLGLYGRPFHIFKFRSMYSDAEERLQHILHEDPELRREYDIFHKLRDDPRVTRAGRFLRRWSLDELPQLINVVRGEMNLVGPRAYLPVEHVRMLDAADVILSRKPGITGLWQVSGRNDLSFSERVQLERWYVEQRSAALDLKILLRTFRVIVSGRGAN